jgi:glycosyltransferase involved in cell wall biosynthesis
MQVLVTMCGAWHLGRTARAFASRDSLAGFWSDIRNRTGVPESLYRRCWAFHTAMYPFYWCTPQIWVERAFFAFFPIWRAWLQQQKRPQFDVVQSVMGYGSEPFRWADRSGALKVIDCQNSHPVSYYGFWQRECDLFCPGEKVPIPRWMFARMTRELEQADVILCPSTFVRDSMLLNGLREEKLFINPFGVDTSTFTKRETLPKVPTFISVGTICLRKGYQYLFRAFEQVKKQVPEARLICVSDYKTDFRKERSKWEGTFEHHLSLTHQQLAEMLKQCTAFVLTSVEEGFARVFMEAMAAGLPIIGTYESGATTLVHDGVEGFIVPARDPAKIADAMLKLARDPQLAQRLGDAAHARGAVKNTWQDYGDRLLARYGEALANKKMRVKK